MTEWVDLDEAPELDDDWFARASFKIGPAIVRRGKAECGPNPEDLTLERDGAQLHRSIICQNEIENLILTLSQSGRDRAGTRLRTLEFASNLFVGDGQIGAIAAAIQGPAARPVRAIYFDKSEEANWALSWHQDRVISVQAKIDAPGFSPWTLKAGQWHVGPPQKLLSEMLTIRIHLDDVRADNAPLLVAAGSHRKGRVSEADINDLVGSSSIYACCARAGDVWVYATPILHSSAKSVRPSHRRVLQVDYAGCALPFGLEWQSLI